MAINFTKKLIDVIVSHFLFDLCVHLAFSSDVRITTAETLYQSFIVDLKSLLARPAAVCYSQTPSCGSPRGECCKSLFMLVCESFISTRRTATVGFGEAFSTEFVREAHALLVDASML